MVIIVKKIKILVTISIMYLVILGIIYIGVDINKGVITETHEKVYDFVDIIKEKEIYTKVENVKVYNELKMNIIEISINTNNVYDQIVLINHRDRDKLNNINGKFIKIKYRYITKEEYENLKLKPTISTKGYYIKINNEIVIRNSVRIVNIW